MVNTGIDIGLTVTCIVHLSPGNNIEVYRFGSKIDPELRSISEDTPVTRYTAYAEYLDKHLSGISPLGTIIMENPMNTKIGNGMRLYTLRGCYLPILGKYVLDRKIKHPTPTEIKKYWTGYGASHKPEMIAACIEKGYKPFDDHESDAIAMANMGIDYY